MTDYEKKIDGLIEHISNPDLRSIMNVQSKNKAYPKDCLNNGSLEQLIKSIIGMEKRIKELETYVASLECEADLT